MFEKAIGVIFQGIIVALIGYVVVFTNIFYDPYGLDTGIAVGGFAPENLKVYISPSKKSFFPATPRTKKILLANNLTDIIPSTLKEAHHLNYKKDRRFDCFSRFCGIRCFIKEIFGVETSPWDRQGNWNFECNSNKRIDSTQYLISSFYDKLGWDKFKETEEMGASKQNLMEASDKLTEITFSVKGVEDEWIKFLDIERERLMNNCQSKKNKKCEERNLLTKQYFACFRHSMENVFVNEHAYLMAEGFFLEEYAENFDKPVYQQRQELESTAQFVAALLADLNIEKTRAEKKIEECHKEFKGHF